MLNHLQSLTPFCIEDDMLSSWLGMMPITFALVYVGTTFKGLSSITHGWNEVSTTHWVFLLLGIGISVILIAYITRIAKASLDKELPEHAQMDSMLAPEKQPLVAGKELDLPRPLTIKIDPRREDLERKMMLKCTA